MGLADVNFLQDDFDDVWKRYDLVYDLHIGMFKILDPINYYGDEILT